MKRLLLSTILPLAVALVPTSEVKAQSVGVGVGFYAGNGYYGPAFGAYPLYYRGFYGNGMSMYGPPVPTYGIVPGTFGASDYRVNNSAPFFGTGLGWYGYRSPSPRPIPNLTYTPPADYLSDNEPPLATGRVPLSDRALNGTMTVEVHVPDAKAVVFIDGNATKQTGEVRTFATPSLPSGENVHYEVRAEWMENGQKVTRTRIAAGKAGERVAVNFLER